jgi:hypothetical protein
MCRKRLRDTSLGLVAGLAQREHAFYIRVCTPATVVPLLIDDEMRACPLGILAGHR